MKSLSLSLLTFAMIIFLSSAFPVDKEKDSSSRLLESRRNDKPIRKKPPGKLPGPKLTEEPSSENSEESKDKSLLGGNKGKKHSHLTTDNRGDSTQLSEESITKSLLDEHKGKKHSHLTTDNGEESKNKSSLDGHKGKKHSHLTTDNREDSAGFESLSGSDKHKKHLARRGRYSGARKEETQEERSIIF